MLKKLIAAATIAAFLVGVFSGCNMQKTANDIEVSAKSCVRKL